MFRRRGQRMFRGMGDPNIPPVLQRANQLMASGDHAGAARAYSELARGAESRFPQRAPLLFMAAGRAALYSGQTQAGMEHLRHGLSLLSAQGRIPRMRAFGQRAIDELRTRDLNAEADEIAGLLNAYHPKDIPPAPTKRPILPTHCPACGGAVHPDEVEWLDDVSAECAYCGSPVRE